MRLRVRRAEPSDEHVRERAGRDAHRMSAGQLLSMTVGEAVAAVFAGWTVVAEEGDCSGYWAILRHPNRGQRCAAVYVPAWVSGPGATASQETWPAGEPGKRRTLLMAGTRRVRFASSAERLLRVLAAPDVDGRADVRAAGLLLTVPGEEGDALRLLAALGGFDDIASRVARAREIDLDLAVRAFVKVAVDGWLDETVGRSGAEDGTTPSLDLVQQRRLTAWGLAEHAVESRLAPLREAWSREGRADLDPPMVAAAQAVVLVGLAEAQARMEGLPPEAISKIFNGP